MPSPFRLRSTLGRTSKVNLKDTLETKLVLHRLGYYPEPTSGLDPFPDNQLFDGIEAFQKDHALKVDGLMLAGGPTERTLNRLLATGSHRSDIDDRPDTGSGSGLPSWLDTLEEAFRGGRGGRGRGPRPEKDCERLYAVDSAICGQVSETKGPAAGARCRASAAERYTACRYGRPMPPLNTGDW